jgi:hypothetical protein
MVRAKYLYSVEEQTAAQNFGPIFIIKIKNNEYNKVYIGDADDTFWIKDCDIHKKKRPSRCGDIIVGGLSEQLYVVIDMNDDIRCCKMYKSNDSKHLMFMDFTHGKFISVRQLWSEGDDWR